jgi:hypothetical protein
MPLKELDPLLDFLRIKSGILPNNADNRYVDGRKNIGRSPEQNERRHEQQHERPNHEGIGAAQR